MAVASQATNQPTNQNQASDQYAKTEGYGQDNLVPDVHAGKRFHETLPQRLSQWFWGTLLGSFPRLHGIALEIRSLPWRSEFQSRLHKRLLSVDFGPDSEISPTGRIVKCKRTHARIADIESFDAICPKATLFESWVFLQGWQAGERFAQSNSGISNMGDVIQPQNTTSQHRAEL